MGEVIRVWGAERVRGMHEVSAELGLLSYKIQRAGGEGRQLNHKTEEIQSEAKMEIQQVPSSLQCFTYLY